MLHKKRFLISILLIIMIASCNNKKVGVIEPADSDNEIAELNTNYLKNTSDFSPVAGAPSLWQSFEVFFKSCVKSSGIPGNSLFSKYRLLYLGPNNPSYLGAVYSKTGVEPKTELTKWLSNDQLKSFVVKGVNVPNCDVNAFKETFLSVALGNLPFTKKEDSTLKFVLENKDSIINSVGNWTVDYILTSDFIKFLNENSSNDNIKYYKDVMTEGKNVVAFKVVKVSGFSADITSKKDISVGLDLEIPIMKLQTVAGADSTLCSLKFLKVDNRTVHVASDGEFYAFALVMKGKKI
jgi:hypothetical protein